MYAMGYGPCVGCGRVFGYNPIHVPSIRINGEREPICRECIEAANPVRIANGLEPCVIHPEAYSPCEASELDQ
jgi:hypothetical protein